MTAKLKYKRILLKLSGEVLHGEKDGGIDFKVVRAICQEVAEVKKLGVEIAIVIGGGNIWRYRDSKDSGVDRVTSDYMGMLATVMNSMALQDQFEKLGIGAPIGSAISMPVVVGTYLRPKALDYLKKGKVLICAGGTGNPYFTTDTAAALRAMELNCDIMLKATKVDFIYDKDPLKHKDAKKFTHLSYQEVLTRRLAVMDLTAVSLCLEKKLPIMVFNLHKKGNIARVVKGEQVGTLIN
jgi:uridylate kinase